MVGFDDERLRSLSYDFLFVMDMVTGKLEPRLATNLDPSPDGMEWTIKLRQGVKWNDGKPFTADDVVWTLYSLCSPKLQPPGMLYAFASVQGVPEYQKGEANSIPGVVKVDDYTIKLKMSKPNNAIRYRIASWLRPAPKHVWEGVPLDKIADDPRWLNNAVTSGPFKPIKHVSGQYTEFEANENYYLGRPNLDKIIVRIADYDAAFAALEAGQVHLVPNVKPLDANRVKGNPKLVIKDDPEIKTWGFWMNYMQKELRDKRVRLGFAHAFDRNSYVKTVLAGYGNPDVRPLFVPRTWQADPELKPYPYDPKKARELFQAGGLDFGKKLTIAFTPGLKPRAEFATVAQANLKDIGITADILPLEAGVVDPLYYTQREKLWFFIAYIPAFGDPWEDSNWFHTQSAQNWGNYWVAPLKPEQREGKTPAEYVGYTAGSLELDKVIEQVRSTADIEKAKPLFHKIDLWVYEDATFMPFVAPTTIQGWSSKLHGPDNVMGGGDLQFWRKPETWWLSE
ncbi:MAG: ABC transporter substrate-binding protein [Chloroflexi bacterium]|nr:ABC transporter substrate-binding protein [Chloroflexota bacterium]